MHTSQPLPRLIPILALTLLAVTAVHAQGPDEPSSQPAALTVVRVYFQTQDRLNALAAEYDVWEVNRRLGYAVIAVGPGDLVQLRAAGLHVEVDQERTKALLAPPGYPCYRTVEEVQDSLFALSATYPNLTELLDIGDSWEKTRPGGQPGYHLWALRLTNEAVPGPKPKLLVMAEAHARELATTEVLLHFVEYLLTHYDVNADVTWLLDHHEVHAVPLANPDGHKLAEQGYGQRKNTNNSNGGSCSNPPTWYDQYGTDLNRNTSFKWGAAGSSGDPCAQTYRGAGPASEPETQALLDYMRALFPDQRGPGDQDPAPDDATGLMITLHSYGNQVLWPWGHTTQAPPNAAGLRAIGEKLASFNGYTPGQASVLLYTTSGTHDDWAYGELGIPAYTFEIGEEFFQACEALPGLQMENLGALLYAARIARTPYLTAQGPDVENLPNTFATVEQGTSAPLTATLDDRRSGGQKIAGAEFYVDTPPWNGGKPQPLYASDGAFDSAREAAEGQVDTARLSVGRHLVFVQGRDQAGHRGTVGASFLYVERPTVGTLTGRLSDASTGRGLAATVAVMPLGLSTTSQGDTGVYTLTLPAGTYTVTATADGYQPASKGGVLIRDGQTTVADLALEPGPCILVVDDDNGAAYEGYYTAALDAAGRAYEVWTVAARGSPDAATLSRYSIIVWFTGDDYSTTLTADDEAALTDFLNGGGRLFLSGQDVGYDKLGDSGNFLGQSLHAAYRWDDTDTYSLSGTAFLEGLQLSIQGNDGANNQVFPSETAPVGDAFGVVAYDSKVYQWGGVAYAGAYRTVYFSFGFEAIQGAAMRAEVMERVVNWLGCRRPCGLVGDVNSDGGVDNLDLMAVVAGWHSQAGGAGYRETLDLDRGGDVDVLDVMLAAAHWGEVCP